MDFIGILAMKFFVVLSAVLVAAAALPAPAPPVVIGTDKLLLGNGSRSYQPRNAGLFGFAQSNIGGTGGEVWTVWDAWALRDAVNTVQPRIVYVRGRIDLSVLFTASPGVAIHVGPYKSIIGGDRNAEIFGGGFRLTNQVHVIIQNLKITNALSYANGESPNGSGGILNQIAGAYSLIDGVEINQSENIWVDHCEFSDDPWNSAATPENQRRHNGLVTVKHGASLVTVSNNIFRNHDMNFLIGHNDNNEWEDTGRLRVTVYLNWFQGTAQRNPMVRFGQVHVLNNLYTDVRSYGIGVYTGARIYGERNVFINTARAWAHPVFKAPAANIHFYNFNNLLINSGFDSGMTGGNIGWEPSQFYSYTPIGNGYVEAHVKSNAGIL